MNRQIYEWIVSAIVTILGIAGLGGFGYLVYWFGFTNFVFLSLVIGMLFFTIWTVKDLLFK